MKTLIVYYSYHHQNTAKIAKIMAKELKANLKKADRVKKSELGGYDLIGLGSGIYWMKHHQYILDLVNKLPEGQKIFIFSTSGIGFDSLVHKPLKQKLLACNIKIVGEFGCKGYDTVGLLKYVGGINKNRPNKSDFNKAQKFVRQINILSRK